MKYLIVLVILLTTGCDNYEGYKYSKGDTLCVYSDPDMRVRIYKQLGYRLEYQVVHIRAGMLGYFRQLDLGECPR